METAINMVREKKRKEVKAKAQIAAEERVIDALVGKDGRDETRQKFRKMLREGQLGNKEIDIEIKETPQGMPNFDIPGMPGASMGMINLGDVFGKAFAAKKQSKRLTVDDAHSILVDEEGDNLLDEENLIKEAIFSVEQNGIVFLDEIDKICARQDNRGGEVSREGVQRDLLPLIEGTIVSTKYGSVKTDHILFISSGAFSQVKPSDLLPELQGRLPIRVELRALTEEDFRRILTEPEFSLIKQYTALLKTEEVTLDFTVGGIKEIAKISANVNESVENIGARRLHTILEKILEEISFKASDTAGEIVVIDEKYVKDRVEGLSQNTDLSRFIL